MRKYFIHCCILIMLLITNVMSQTKEIVGYFPEWGVNYKPYYVKNIITSGAAEKLTIINYAFGIPTPDSSGKIKVSFETPRYAYAQIYSAENSVDGIADDSSQQLRGHFNQLRKLKKIYPHIKIVVSLGGWLGSVYFSKAALTPESRKIFVDACINLFIKGNLPILEGAGGKGVAASIFDGIDIDWEFPLTGGVEGIFHNQNDMDNLTELFKLFRSELNKINPDYLLTVALPSSLTNLKNYNIESDSKYLNWFLLMNYDYYGGWSPTTGHQTNLLKSKFEPSSGRGLSQNKIVKYLLEQRKIPSNKIIPGAAFYGRGWKNVSNIQNGLFQQGAVAEGIYEEGFNYYSDLIKLVDKDYKLYWDETAFAPWLYSEKEKIFWTLDTPKSLKLKAKYIEDHDLRGMMFWDLAGDDSVGTMINTIYVNLTSLRKTNSLATKSMELNSKIPTDGK